MTQGRRLGPYELLEREGQGDYLIVYRARDTATNRPVVLKLVHSHLQEDAELTERFRRRAEQLLTLEHPTIAPVLDVHVGQNGLYMVSAVPPGESLAQRCTKACPLEVDDVLSIITQVAEALDYAHSQGVFHLDVRPANIYVQNETAVLANFFVLESCGGAATYMAPEQLDETSGDVVDRRTDSYALGVVVYKLLTGRPPFDGTPTDVAAAHLTQRPLAPRVHNPELYPAIDAILLKALAKQPQSRYQSAGELAVVLHESVQTAQTRRMADGGVFESKGGTSDDPIRRSASLQDSIGIPTWVWVGLIILLVVIVASIILLATG
jgi:serine/threonine protein kinase